MTEEERGYRLEANVRYVDGALNFHLSVFGDALAKREGYKENKGLDALRYYLMRKHDWLPRDVKAMSIDDLRFALSEEMHGWTLPKAARHAYPEAELYDPFSEKGKT